MNPTRSILDPRFKYRSAAQTDVRETWLIARRMQEMEKSKVALIKPRKADD
jgi:hypothetical protein